MLALALTGTASPVDAAPSSLTKRAFTTDCTLTGRAGNIPAMYIFSMAYDVDFFVRGSSPQPHVTVTSSGYGFGDTSRADHFSLMNYNNFNGNTFNIQVNHSPTGVLHSFSLIGAKTGYPVDALHRSKLECAGIAVKQV
ncbi:uncharacterized protein L969DRAFT_49661 [Mixia osmundae IAM 14324]|uniref:Uncharacterized protein n=1 Tax=Mixia osmundae (strain CBS 9802 / IAM 14324 / JCM 22182 / KY 12970) TaxID=764103 RepID=G7E726_MIXOS|nr:uncharacterized protein L969DRAFT_49661 [Mixia osmundae IAM 14324]KEI38982.1 hypothetical protein L969DRAFT_49661 [Mixia osmundae IAM 14324]GAA98636.1 hypothetical protein E5Q_05323 [Mixia osmundae IAM 14324]